MPDLMAAEVAFARAVEELGVDVVIYLEAGQCVRKMGGGHELELVTTPVTQGGSRLSARATTRTIRLSADKAGATDLVEVGGTRVAVVRGAKVAPGRYRIELPLKSQPVRRVEMERDADGALLRALVYEERSA